MGDLNVIIRNKNQRFSLNAFTVLCSILFFPFSVLADDATNASNSTSSSSSSSTSKEPARRAKPAPLDSVFPSGEYPGPTIGVPNTDPIFPMTKALWDDCPCVKKNDIRLYGWINPSFNLSSSKHSNIPMGYDIVPNRLELQEFVLRIERQPDTVQTDHVDWGFRLTNLAGIDYRATTAQGIFSGQLLHHNNLYGYDPVEFYAQLYFPDVAQGLLITAGRYFSPIDIEGALAPYNYMFTHSLMFTYDISTMTGINGTLMLNDQWTILLGIHGGGDVAPWNRAAHPSGQFLVRWVSEDNNDSLWGGIDSINRGFFTRDHDNLQEFALTWTHRFCPEFHILTEAYYMYQYDAVSGGTCNFGPVRSFGGGGGCGALIPGKSPVWGAVNYIEYKVSDKQFVSLRFDYLDDVKGERTGFSTKYASVTFGFTYDITSLFLVRPEIRYEQATTNVTPYDLGTKKRQTSFNIDAIYRF